MPAFPKVYTDNAHASEVAHTAQNATTINGAIAAGATSLVLTSAAGWPTSGYLDITDGTNGNETIGYYGLTGSTIQLAKATAFLHPNLCVINWWYYSLAVGDQTNGIPNDGTNATPVGTNTNTWYLYNAGDQIAQGIVLATVNGAPSTAQGQLDTYISHLTATTGFSQSDTIGNIAVGAQQQFWVDAQIPSGQSAANNPQICQISITFSTV